MALCSVSAAADDGEPRYLDVASQGYSRFEISEGDVVAFYTEGVEFTYLNIHVEADNLRYNHASQEAIVEGVAKGSLDDAVFSCRDLYLNGAKGAMEVSGGVHLEYAGTQLDCETIKANFPGGETRLELGDLIVVAGPSVTAVTAEGHRILAPELTFSGQDMLVTTDSPTRLELALDETSISEGAVLDLRGLVMEFDSMRCLVNDQFEPLDIDLSHITGISDDITFSASKLQAEPQGNQADVPAGDWFVSMTSIDGDVTIEDNWLACAADEAGCIITDMQLTEIELNDSVSVRTNTGAFYADRAQAIPTPAGFELILPADVAVEFNLARLSGQDPIEFESIGEAN